MTDFISTGLAAAGAAFVLGRALESWSRKRQLLAAVASTGSKPSLYPRINKDACICAGACVTACPEGDVIAIIDGRPQLVRASACVGHADCVRSCPVSAIELVIGSPDNAVEVPVATSTFETTTRGLYVAGEVTGIGLIHNAVAQGRQAAAAALDAASSHDCAHDLVVIGGGPAGIGAALEAKRRGARCVVFEKGQLGGAMRSYPRQKVVMTAPLDLPGFGKVKLRRTSKEALVELFETVIQRTELSVVESSEVRTIEPITGGFRVATSSGTTTAHRVVLAIGRRGAPRRLGVPGDSLPHVVFEVRDPERHAGERAVVVGGGDSAVELALALASQAGTWVTLVHRGADLGRCKPANQTALAVARKTGRLDVMLGTRVRAVTTEHVEIDTPGERREIPASLVACCLGADLPAQWLRSLGIELRELRGEPLVV